jgi:hypothetical protein
MKLAGALVVPMLALVVVTTIEVLSTPDDVNAVHDQAELARTSLGPPSVLSKIEDERNAASVYLLGAEEMVALPVEDNADARGATDRALGAFRDDVEQRGGGVAEAYRPALGALDTLPDLRARNSSHPTGHKTVWRPDTGRTRPRPRNLGDCRELITIIRE